MIKIPVVEDLQVNTLGVTLVDQRTVSRVQEKTARIALKAVLQQSLLGNVRPETRLCGMEQSEHENALFAEALSANPQLTYTEFFDSAGDDIALDDSCPDPRLDVMVFLVFGDAGQILGSFTFYNISVEDFSASPIVASAMPMPGCRGVPGRSVRETWSGIMDWVLTYNFTTLGGEEVDFTEWRLPTRESHRWNLSPEEELLSGSGYGDAVSDGILADLSGHDLTITEEGVPTSIRRID